jgi:hypothetical protein
MKIVTIVSTHDDNTTQTKEEITMKKTVFVFMMAAILYLFYGCASTPLTTKTEYSEVVDANGFTADEIFTKANLYFVSVFRSAESVIEYSDKTEGVIKGKFSVRMLNPGAFSEVNLFSTFMFEARDGRYGISFTDPYQETVDSSATLGKFTYQIATQDQFDIVLQIWKDFNEGIKQSIQAKDEER